MRMLTHEIHPVLAERSPCNRGASVSEIAETLTDLGLEVEEIVNPA